MVQILPYIQSPLEQLIPHINQTAGAIGSGLNRQARSKADASVLQQLNNPNLSPIQMTTLWSSLSPEARSVHEPFLHSQLRTQETEFKEKIKNEGALKKSEDEKQATQQELLPSFQRLEELIPRTGARIPGTKSFFRSIPGTDAFKEAKEFDTLGFWATDKTYAHFNKGTITDTKLELIKKDLAPRSDLSEGENRSRINSLKRINGLPENISKEKFDKILDKEIKNAEKESKKSKSSSIQKSERVKPGTKLTKDIVEGYKKEGLTRDEAENKARELGYEF